MTKNEFNSIIDSRVETIQEILRSKGKEYQSSTKDDVLHNFKEAAKIMGVTKEEALDGMMMKHYVSYRDMLNSVKEGKVHTAEYVEEKIGDLINYFVLMEACMKERIDEKENEDAPIIGN